MENTILMTQPKNPEKPSPEPRENYLTYSVNYTNFRADALSGATGKQKTKPRDIPGDPRESSETPESDRIFIPYDTDESNSADSAERDIIPAEEFPETAELPRAARSAYRRRSGIPMLYTFLTAAGLILGIYVAASAPGADISGSLLCGSGDFLGLLLRRLFWGAAFLIAEYVCGFFALGRLLVWAAPLICGLGTGAALAGASALGAFLLAASACEVDLLDRLAFERSLRAVEPLLDCLGGCILRQLEAVGVGCHRALSREGQRRERAFFRVGEGEHISDALQAALYRVDRARERRFDTVRECGDDALARLKEPRHGSRDRVLDRGDSIRERRLDGCEPLGDARGDV